jgi:large subunit ribosomal protein L23
VALVERANTVVFIVDRSANKPQIIHAFEQAFDAKGKVARVNTEITANGEKKAFVKLKKEFNAGDVAVKLGIV